MDLKFGDIQETVLIPLAIKASETARPNARIRDEKAKEIIETLGVDVSKYPQGRAAFPVPEEAQQAARRGQIHKRGLRLGYKVRTGIP